MERLPRPFLAWLVAVYAAWLALVTALGLWSSLPAQWPIAASMALGSFVAGATPMGGGSVGFPVLVLLFDQPASLGRDFSFAIQSVGMTSASVLILSRRQPVYWRMLGPALVGAALGTPLGLLTVADRLPELAVKLMFSVAMAAFGLLHLRRVDELVAMTGPRARDGVLEPLLGLAAGLVGGATIAASTGVGTDMLVYMLMVLVSRVDLRVAIPTSVILMAATSLVGVATQAVTGRLDPHVLAPWLAAAPVVAVGAPFGSFLVSRVGRVQALRFVSALCLVQLAWTLFDTRALLGVPGAIGVLGLVALGWLAFEGLHAAGERLARFT